MLLDRVTALSEDAAVCRAEEDADKIHRMDDFRYAAKSWSVERRVIARIEETRQGGDTRLVVTNLNSAPRWLYELLYCGRGHAENLAKGQELHLASVRTTCSKATANHFRMLIHTAAYWLTTHAEGPRRQDFVLARRPVRHRASRFRKDRSPRHRTRHPHQGLAAAELTL